MHRHRHFLRLVRRHSQHQHPALPSPPSQSTMTFAFISSTALHRQLHQHSSLCNPSANTYSLRPKRHRPTRFTSSSCISSSSSSSSPSSSTSTASDNSDVPIGKYMTSDEIREAFLSFYAERNHTVIPSASLIPSDPTILLNIAGMVPFKPIFLGLEAAPAVPRATSCQKCVRTNDIENVGVTKRHHTFFEMLGNFSFGDYFKPRAIRWAWQLLTEVYAIPPQRLAVSVYTDDSEAYDIWVNEVGVDPARVQRLGEKDNFWFSGSTGPCGPCSEIYFDFNPTNKTDPLDLEDDDRFIELYNLVFMQYMKDETGALLPLQKQNIDTGMGLERMAQVLQRVDTNYETDLILPIIESIIPLTAYADTPYAEMTSKQRLSLRVIGDHLRAVCHLIADGVKPSNIGRGYIVRRLIRRVVRHGRLLGIEGDFCSSIIPTVATLASGARLTAVHDKLEAVSEEVRREEIRFLQTLVTGEARLEDVMESARTNGVVPGADAFELYDTFGFPLELTQEIAAEAGMSIDTVAFDQLMEEQRARARAARDSSAAFDLSAAPAALAELVATAGAPTVFQGYEATKVSDARILQLVALDDGVPKAVPTASPGQRVQVVLDKSPFYAEGGGQVGDTGELSSPNGARLAVLDTQRVAAAGMDYTLHACTVGDGEVRPGDTLDAGVDPIARRAVAAHHSATHLLQAALRTVLPDGSEVSQAGSLVDPDRLRFDFHYSRAVSSKELAQVEDTVNDWVALALPTTAENMSLDAAKSSGAIAMFGEKYSADDVRVISLGGVSRELCGGTHVKSTADIGPFKIIAESGPSAGVRRIEAVCGLAVLPYLRVRDDIVRELCADFRAPPEEVVPRVSALRAELRTLDKKCDELSGELAATAVAQALSDGRQSTGPYSFVVRKIEDGITGDALKSAIEKLTKKTRKADAVIDDNTFALLAAADEETGKIAFVAAAGKNVVKEKGVKAGNVIREVAKICGGGGGGKPNFAQAGGKDIAKLQEALQYATATIEKALS